MTPTHQPFSWGIDSREQGKMGCCAPRARRVPRSLSRSDFQDLPSPQSFSAWMLQGLRTHPRALQLERWLPAWLLLWTSCWCPEHFAKLVIKWNPGQLPGTDSHDLWGLGSHNTSIFESRSTDRKAWKNVVLIVYHIINWPSTRSLAKCNSFFTIQVAVRPPSSNASAQGPLCHTATANRRMTLNILWLMMNVSVHQHRGKRVRNSKVGTSLNQSSGVPCGLNTFTTCCDVDSHTGWEPCWR